MSFVQCKDDKEVDLAIEQRKNPHCFVTEDFRVYDTMGFSDGELYYELPPNTLIALMNLQDGIEFMSGHCGGYEMGFDNLVRHAKDLEETWRKALEQIKFKPLVRKKRK